MPTAGGPNTLGESNLVFAYDTGDVSNSYLGEPTANLIPSPGLNALPTFGNSWGTYNTNQYCGNNGCGVYWNLATVSSISSNIVTTSTAHGLRTYDVINPETTGGGVNAGQQYFVKVISTTQFSLHEYNGSQDGSQGYSNPTTGTFKVHDSIALDQKVSINSSSFPTKWFGNPHQPNSGLVKEIRTNGYRNPYTGKFTDCIRLHIPRPTGVDGMSYGADASVTIGQTYTTSFWVKSVSETAVGRGVYFQHYNYGGPGGAAIYDTYFTLGPVGQWQRVSFSYTVAYNTLISYWFPNGDYIYSFDLANIQIENKSHATQFIAGTRSATQGLLPLIGNSTIDLSNVSFDSNAQIIFDGTDDYIESPAITLSGDFTISQIVNLASSANGPMPIGGGYYANGSTYQGYVWFRNNVNEIRLAVDGEQTVIFSVNSSLWANKTIAYTIQRLGSTATFYINGAAIATGTISTNNFTIRTIGYSYHPVYSSNGTINNTFIYNRALTAQEVRQNYQQYKTRFNLS